MSPERIINTNMWKLLVGESVTGMYGTIHGPETVRVTEYPEANMLGVQGFNLTVYVEGLDFPSVVRTTPANLSE